MYGHDSLGILHDEVERHLRDGSNHMAISIEPAPVRADGTGSRIQALD